MTEWNIPSSYDELVLVGETQWSILGVETHDNMHSMSRFVEAVPGLGDKIEVDDGTQVVVTHPDLTKVIVIDAGGLGDFWNSGFDVTVVERSETGNPVPEHIVAEIAKRRLTEAAPQLLEALRKIISVDDTGPEVYSSTGHALGRGRGKITDIARAAIAAAVGAAP